MVNIFLRAYSIVCSFTNYKFNLTFLMMSGRINQGKEKELKKSDFVFIKSYFEILLIEVVIL